MERSGCRLESLILRNAYLPFVSSPSPRYYIPGDSPWPFLGALALFLTLSGTATLILGSPEVGAVLLSLGVVSLLAVVAGWFISAFATTDVAGFGLAVNRSFRWSVLAFLSAELLLFGVCWGAFALAREWQMSARAATGPLHHALTQGPLTLLLSSLSLLLSSASLVMAQQCERHRRGRTRLSFLLATTVVLGLLFFAIQAPEYGHALALLGAGANTHRQSLQILSLTVHGVHVLLALTLLVGVWMHSLKNHFTATQRFGLQAVTWYWQFLDVCWVALLLLAYFQ